MGKKKFKKVIIFDLDDLVDYPDWHAKLMGLRPRLGDGLYKKLLDALRAYLYLRYEAPGTSRKELNTIKREAALIKLYNEILKPIMRNHKLIIKRVESKNGKKRK